MPPGLRMQEPDGELDPPALQLHRLEAENATDESHPVTSDPNTQIRVSKLGIHTVVDPSKHTSAISPTRPVHNHGDTELITDINSRGEISTKGSKLSTAELPVPLVIDHADASHVAAARESGISSHGQITLLDEDAGVNSKAEASKEQALGEAIRASRQASAGREGGKEFLPNDAFDKILTKKRIRLELESLSREIPLEKVDELTSQIWDGTSPMVSNQPSGKKSQRRIFAILALMEKTEEIVAFIKEKVYDSDLPFILSNGSRAGLCQLDRRASDGTLSSIQLFEKWQIHNLELFNNYQWQLLAPFFHLSTRENPTLEHYALECHHILPFIEDNEVRRVGGFSDVWVKIHPAHHNCPRNSAENSEYPSYAVKRLRHDDHEAFDAEVSNLKRFIARDHLHLTRLLATYSWREQYYLLFPWADGNLLDFWKEYPRLSLPNRDYDFTLWFAKQCLGIAEGLKMIHTADKPGGADDVLYGDRHQIHGRHGDLKPENILWFKTYQDADRSFDMGVMKISDFGLTRFHGTMSRSRSNAEKIAVSPTYRAPEYDIANTVSQSYDIWTLGCVFLEFATWFLLGWEEVDRFAKERVNDNHPSPKSNITEDVFFNFVRIGDGLIGARAKDSVANEFQVLYHQKNCSDFMLDFLIFIKTRLLRMDPGKRAGCDEIVKKLTGFHETCLKEQKYCMQREKVPPTRAGTDLSLLTPSPLEFTAEMGKIINRAPLPEYTGRLETDPQPLRSLSNANETIIPGGVQSESKLEVPDRMMAASKSGPLRETASGASYTNKATIAAFPGSIDLDMQHPRPQSPTKKAYGEKKRPSIVPSILEEKEMGAIQNLPLEKPNTNEAQKEPDQQNLVQPGPRLPRRIIPRYTTFTPPRLGSKTSMNHSPAKPKYDSDSKNSSTPENVEDNRTHDTSESDLPASDYQTMNGHGVHGLKVINSAGDGQKYGEGGDKHASARREDIPHEKLAMEVNDLQDGRSGDPAVSKKRWRFSKALLCGICNGE